MSLDTKILYIRHGEVPGNDPNANYIYTGCGTNSPLTKKGEGQAEECARKVSELQANGTCGKITAIYSSDLTRAVQTATPIAEKLGFSIYAQANLREISWGGCRRSTCRRDDEEIS